MFCMSLRLNMNGFGGMFERALIDSRGGILYYVRSRRSRIYAYNMKSVAYIALDELELFVFIITTITTVVLGCSIQFSRQYHNKLKQILCIIDNVRSFINHTGIVIIVIVR